MDRLFSCDFRISTRVSSFIILDSNVYNVALIEHKIHFIISDYSNGFVVNKLTTRKKTALTPNIVCGLRLSWSVWIEITILIVRWCFFSYLCGIRSDEPGGSWSPRSYVIMRRKFHQWWSAIPLISTSEQPPPLATNNWK